MGDCDRVWTLYGFCLPRGGALRWGDGPCGARFAETELSAILPPGGGWEIGWGDHRVIIGGGVGGTPVDSAEIVWFRSLANAPCAYHSI